MKTIIFASNCQQEMYPVGPNKDAYYIITSFTLDAETNEMQSNSEVKLNYNKGNYSSLFRGTYKECYTFLQQISVSRNDEEIITYFVVEYSGSNLHSITHTKPLKEENILFTGKSFNEAKEFALSNGYQQQYKDEFWMYGHWIKE